jgi:hypothetical protein
MARTYRRDPETHGTTRKRERTACRGRDCYCKGCAPKRGNSYRLNIRDLRRLDAEALAEVG